jgi:hypothetical protein
MGHLRGAGVWQVTECRRPRRWAIRSHDPGGRGGATITYDLESSPVGTRFERTLEYELRGLYALADWLFLNALLRRQSIRALENLKRLLESSR